MNVADLHIIWYPDPVLRSKAKPIAKVDAQVQAVAQRMLELMDDAAGIGLAAPQIGLSWRLFVVDVPPSEGDEDSEARSPDDTPPTATASPLICINPTLHNPQGEWEPFREGCLSLPHIRGEVRRPSIITLKALDINGNPFEMTAGGLLARCIQHEFDHLEGVLITDKMAQIDRMKNRARLRDLERGIEPSED